MLEQASVNEEKPLTRRERRKRATRERLKQATADLLVIYGYDGFNIQDVTTHADLARGTFYVHFRDKEDVVWRILQDSFDRLNQGFNRLVGDSNQRRMQKWIDLFAYVDQNRGLLQVILGEQGHIKLVRRMQTYIAAVIVQDTNAGVSEPVADVPVDFAAEFIAGAMIRVIDWWLAHPEAYTVSQVAEMFYTLVVREPLPKMAGG